MGHLPKFIAAVDATGKATVDIVDFAMGTNSYHGEDDPVGVAWVFHEHEERGTPGAVEMRTRNMTRRAASVFRARHTRTAGSIVLMDCLMGEKQVSCTRAYRCSSDADCQFHG